eukprot:Blabericola_migrator_1__6004@NODE_3026_length_2101_cov_674_652409_g1834_i1_p2_GENE_NODE_3026_length_2101_cov_674_652409_g1834_i1NODE_3026_length_2101_cov_674_652409_g1834_i1_p2_ORF_typecomplete_len112_score7_70_NODE_3026_length_2101_cov_674_652409_g1834_i117422077
MTPVKLLLDMSGNISLNGVFLKGLGSYFNGFILHGFGHVDIFDDVLHFHDESRSHSPQMSEEIMPLCAGCAQCYSRKLLPKLSHQNFLFVKRLNYVVLECFIWRSRIWLFF